MPSVSSGAPGVPASNKNPGTFFTITLGASANSAGGNLRTVLVIANKTSAGSATVDTQIYDCPDPATAVALAGPGSEAALAVAGGYLLEPGAAFKLLLCAEPGGGVAATQTLTVAGGTAVGSGTFTIFIHRVQVDVTVRSGDVVTTIAANIAAKINAFGNVLCVTATVAGAVVTLRYRHLGTRGNLVSLRTKVDATITVTTFTLGGAALGGGTGTDDLTNALATAAAKRYNYYAVAQVDTANLQKLQTQLTTMAGPLVGKVQQGISSNLDTLTNATNQATALNEPRQQIVWHKKGEDLSVVVAAAWAARRSMKEQADPSVNLTTFSPTIVDLWPVVGPPANETDYATSTDTASALDSGLTPLGIRPNDKHPQVLVSITTHSQDSLGNPDTRVLTTNMVTVPDSMSDDLRVFVPSAFPNCKIRPDEQLGDDPLPPRTTTPTAIKSEVYCFVKKNYADLGYIYQLDVDAAAWAYNLAANSNGRCNATMGAHPTPWFFQFSCELLQLSA